MDMALFNTDRPIGWGVVNFTGGEEFDGQGTDRDDGTYAISVTGHVTETEKYVSIEAYNGITFVVPHGMVDLMMIFPSKDELDDYLIHAEIEEFKGASE